MPVWLPDLLSALACAPCCLQGASSRLLAVSSGLKAVLHSASASLTAGLE